MTKVPATATLGSPPTIHWPTLAALGIASYAVGVPYFITRFSVDASHAPLPLPGPLAIEFAKFVVLSILASWAGSRWARRVGLPDQIWTRSATAERFFWPTLVGLGATTISLLSLRELAPSMLNRYLHVLGNIATAFAIPSLCYGALFRRADLGAARMAHVAGALVLALIICFET